MQKITPFLWFDTQAEEAANYYTSIFNNSEVLSVSRGGDTEAGEPGPAFMVNFQVEGQEFYALNGGPHFKFNPAISLFVSCENQEEVDDLWTRLCDGGAPSQCGWLTDKFGLSWQIIPKALGELMGDPDPVKSKRVMNAMFKMTKIDIAELQRAYEASE